MLLLLEAEELLALELGLECLEADIRLSLVELGHVALQWVQAHAHAHSKHIVLRKRCSKHTEMLVECNIEELC